MNAAEKLRALLHEAEKGNWDNDLYGEPLLMALPQIIAVVEAAEEVAARVPTIARPIPAALAALEEVLG